MFLENYIKDFWRGKLKLWHSFWIVGGIGGILIGQIIIFIEKTFFSSSSLNLLEFSTRGKILILIWVVFSTIGIWRSAENYNGPSFLKIILDISEKYSSKTLIVGAITIPSKCLKTIFRICFLLLLDNLIFLKNIFFCYYH